MTVPEPVRNSGAVIEDRSTPTTLRARDWANGFIAGMASYLDAAALTSVAISLAIWRDQFALGPWQTGLLTFGLSASFAIGCLAGGWLADRFGRVRMLGVDVAVFVLGALLLLLAPNGSVLVLAAAVMGAAAGADLPTSLAAISELVPPAARGRLVGLTQVLWIAGILGTFLLGFAVSGLGHAGTQILIGHLVVLGTITWLLRLRLRVPEPTRLGSPATRRRPRLRALLDPEALLPLLVLTGYFASWNIAANTMGSLGPYFLVTVTGLTQTEATGLVLLTFPLSLIVALVFVRLADTRWRDRLFVVAAAGQIVGFLTGALTGGTVVAGMAVLIVLYSLSNTFAGEAAFRVWTQQLFPADLRSTATGISFAIARSAAAACLLVAPTIIERDPAWLIWILTGCVTVSAVVGLIITRRLMPRPPH